MSAVAQRATVSAVARRAEAEGGSDEAIHAFPIQFSNSHDRSDAVIPGWSAGPDPESRDSGFDASHRPGMTESAPIPNMTSNSRHDFTPSPRNAPEPLMNLPPKEGVGNAGCPLHPRPRVHLVLVERTRVTTSTPESPDIPARNGFNGFLRALPGDRACLPPSSAD